MKTIVVIPTYDEKDNVAPMAEAVLADEELALSRPSPSAPTAQGLGSSPTAQGHDSSPTDQGLDSRENFRSTGERDEPQAKDAKAKIKSVLEKHPPIKSGRFFDFEIAE